MKRRSFIFCSLLTLAGAGVFAVIQWVGNSGKSRPLARPKFLSQLCDARTIRSLGRAYLKLRPDEGSEDMLLNDLLTEKFKMDTLEGNDLTNAESEIEKKIRLDFTNDNIVLVQGWVLAITEARQCAFFSKLNT